MQNRFSTSESECLLAFAERFSRSARNWTLNISEQCSWINISEVLVLPSAHCWAFTDTSILLEVSKVWSAGKNYHQGRASRSTQMTYHSWLSLTSDCSQLLRVSTYIIPDRKAACKTIFLPHWPQRLRSLIAWMKQKLRPFDVSEDSEESCWQPADQGNAQQAAIININADEPPRPKRSQVRTIGDHVAAWRMSFVR